jgi:16S rRNA (cytosine967-C5)-methyltransferase
VLAAEGATVVACDVDPRRLARVHATCARQGLAERVRLVACDGTAALGEALFDGVLVDAPCTNTGVLGARPGARWRFGPQVLRDLVALQARLLSEASRHVAPGGRLVWSTCSLEPEENERQVRAFLEAHPGWELETRRAALPGGPGETVPGPVDGGWAARLRRRGYPA